MIKKQYLDAVGITQQEVNNVRKGEQVDFKDLKAKISITSLLQYLCVLGEMEESPTTDGELIGACCPACGNESGKKAFIVNVDKNTFVCRSCKERGSVIDMVSLFNGGRAKCNIREAAAFLSLIVYSNTEETEELIEEPVHEEQSDVTRVIEESDNVARFPREQTTGRKGELHTWLTEARDDMRLALKADDLNKARSFFESVEQGLTKIVSDTRTPRPAKK